MKTILCIMLAATMFGCSSDPCYAGCDSQYKEGDPALSKCYAACDSRPEPGWGHAEPASASGGK